LDAVPRIGDNIMVTKIYLDHYRNKKLPLYLEVVNVIWTEDYVICELWYRKVDIEASKISGVELF